ncbi:hypothetical protein V8F33_012993 [Rhypophila sp. PSN 637]
MRLLMLACMLAVVTRAAATAEVRVFFYLYILQLSLLQLSYHGPSRRPRQLTPGTRGQQLSRFARQQALVLL